MGKKIVFLLLFLSFFTIHISAFDPNELGIDTKPIIDLIPEEIKDLIPNEFIAGDDVVGISDSFTFSSVLTVIAEFVKSAFRPFIKTFSTLLATIVACSVLNAAKNSIADKSMMKIVGFVSMITVSLASYSVLKDMWLSLEVFLDRMNVLINSMLPVMTLLYTLGGNVATAVVNSSGTAITLTLINTVCQNGLFPFLKTLFVFSLTSSIGGFKGIDGISKSVRTVFTVVLSSVMTIFSIFLLFKTNLAMSSDGIAARSIKFAGSFIPVVGSALGDSVRSIMSGLGLIKSASGFVGIMIVLCVTLPVLLTVISNKICFDFVGGIALMLGCENEGKIMKDLSSMLNFVLALAVSISVLFVFELTIFINTSLVLGE